MIPYTNNKENVTNPIVLLNTVGQEVYEIATIQGYSDVETTLGIKNLVQIDKLNNKQLKSIVATLGGDDELRQYLVAFQENYLREKAKGQEAYKKSKKNFTKLKVVLPLLRNEFTAGLDRLDDILDFFNVDSEADVFNEAEQVAVLFRQQNDVDVDPINLKAWLRRGELDFERMNLPQYNGEQLKAWIDEGQWKSNIESVDYFKSLPNKLQSYGVALVLVPFLPKTVYGAVRWIDGHPLIQISDRNHDLATCWFTLFHEFGHVILHRDTDSLDGVIEMSKTTQRKIETEANQFASQYLFKGDELRKDIFGMVRKGEYIQPSELVKQYKVPMLFVAYWLIKAQYQPNFQKRIHIDFASMYQ